MKQLVIFAVTALTALSARAEYTALAFKTTGGETHSIQIKGLEILFSDDSLLANNSKTVVMLPLKQVESMQFIDDSVPGAVESISPDRLSERTSVYDLNGRNIGVYASFSDAMAGIPAGVYLFRYADGTTLKIVKQ